MRNSIWRSDGPLASLLLVLAWFPLLAVPAHCSSQFSGFAQLSRESNIKAYARDLGGILGSGTYHTGRGLGFAGFDVGFHGAMQFKPGRTNDIMNRSGVKNFGMPWFQAEIGLPLKFDGFIRGFNYEDLTVSGGGLRYALLTLDAKPGKPQILLAADGESFCHTSFSGVHFGGSLVASVTTKYFQPFMGFGIDRTRLIVKQSADQTILGRSFFVYGERVSVGVNVRPITFSYLTVAGVLRNGNMGVQFGAGARF